MKKRFLVMLVLVAVLIPSMLSASVVNLSIGATAQYTQDFKAISDSIDNDSITGELGEIDNYAFGADVRLKILLAEIDMVGMFGSEKVSGTDYTTISVLTTAGISLDVLNFARLGFGMGPRFNVFINSDDATTEIKDSNGALVDWGNFGEAFINSPVAYRATLDFKIGKMMLGFNYTVDSDYTFKNWEKIEDLFSKAPDSGMVGISFLFSLI